MSGAFTDALDKELRIVAAAALAAELREWCQMLYRDGAKPILTLPLPLWESPFPEDPGAPKIRKSAS